MRGLHLFSEEEVELILWSLWGFHFGLVQVLSIPWDIKLRFLGISMCYKVELSVAVLQEMHPREQFSKNLGV